MASYTCKIRIHLPLTSGLKPDTSNPGHYDIQIMKTGLTLLGKTYNNPVISYGGGQVWIYNGSEFSPQAKYMYCHAPITVTDEEIRNFVTGWLDTYCDKKTGVDIHDVTSGDYQNYSLAKNNCFGAVGEWCALMGDPFLKSIHDKNAYTAYIAWEMYKQYHAAWIFDALRT
nr:MAG TPA: Suv3 C-terminal domain 1 [Caudoviricetes sp.]